jgi:alginate O-acetyltransferase complex protein AlgJ
MRRVALLALAATFVIALFAGTAVSYARMASDRFPLPGWGMRDLRWYPTRFETALSDHLAGREALIGWHARLKVNGLRVSSTPRVWLGKDGWLFLNHWSDLGHSDLTNYLEGAVERWGAAIRARRDWCEARGIRFLVVVVPDKQTIYPERLPAVVRGRPDPCVLDRVLARWRADPPVPVLDLRADLLAAKQFGPVYYRYDTHWTPMGTYVGAARTVAELADVLPGSNLPWTEVPHGTARAGPGDLWRFLGMPGTPPDEVLPVPHRQDARARPTGETISIPKAVRIEHIDSTVWEGGAGPRVVLFHDSFADLGFKSVLGDHCSRLAAVGSYHLVEEVVERERPSVVVCELAERMLACKPPPRR